MKGIFKKSLSIILALVLSFSCFIGVIAANSEESCPLKITVNSNRERYSLIGIAKVNVTIENISKEAVEAIHADVIFDKLVPVKKSSVVSMDKDKLNPGEKVTFSYNAMLSSSYDALRPLQKLLLKFVSLFVRKSAVSDPVFYLSAYSDETIPLKFGEIESNEIIRVWYMGEISQKDTDNDGVIDYWEHLYGTDKTKPDTDDDGLTDWQEIHDLSTNPLVVDTDGNGITDYNEDFDGDSIANGKEYTYATDPTMRDSDTDGLSDYEEIFSYKTKPTAEDTDTDGASDGWEASNGFDPLTANRSFTVSESYGELSEDNPVSPTVNITLNGNNAESLSVEPVGIEKNPLLSENVPGYLGTAYEFHTDEPFDHATLTFNYDASLGQIGEDFQPRIYYFNEENGTFEELPNQEVRDGYVSASVTHFSTYILLNSVDFDKVWETEIRPPVNGSSGGSNGIDMLLLIDCSGSMGPQGANNDPKNIRLDVSKKLVDKAGTNDQFAVVSFGEYINLLTDFTKDKDTAYNAIDRVGNTDYKTYINKALTFGFSTFDKSSRNESIKYMILLTDGKSSDSVTVNYASEAKKRNITIFTVGLGSNLDEILLKAIATSTGGNYYHATVADDLYEVYDLIEQETIDYTTDTNNDGISDYFTQLIFEGDLRLTNGSDEFMGTDFNYDADGNISDDFDGDGLKNGEELIVKMVGNRVTVSMYSDPMMKYSDGDKYDDKAEKQNGTNPLKTDFDDYYTDWLCANDNYYAPDKVAQFDDSWLYQIDTAAVATIYGVWNPGELFRDEMINYFYKYSGDSYINQMTTEYAKLASKESLISGINTTKDVLSKIKKYTGKLADATDYLPKVREVAKYTAESKELISRINSLSPSYGTSGLTRLLDNELVKTLKKISDIDSTKAGHIQLKINGIAEKYQNFMSSKVGNTGLKVGTTISMGLNVISGGIDIADTIMSYSKINANTDAFKQNLDILCQVRDHSGRGFTSDAAKSIINAMGDGYGSYGNELAKAITADTAEMVGQIVLTVAAQNPYVKAVKAVIDGLALITGIRDDVKQQYKMICICDMADSTVTLFKQSVTHGNKVYTVKDENSGASTRYLTHIAQMRVVGEHRYCDFMNWEGIIGWFTSNEGNEKDIELTINNTKTCVNSLNLSTYVDIDKIS